jgi:phosphatidate cytidylyltransferase
VNINNVSGVSVVSLLKRGPEIVNNSEPHSSSRENVPKAPNASGNLMRRIASAAVLAPIALVVAYVGGWPFVLFWTLAAIAVLWEWIALVAGTHHKVTFSVCSGALAAAAFVGWLHHPIMAALLVGLGTLAGAVFASGARRAWIASGVLYAGMMLLAPMLLRFDEDFGLAALTLLFAVVWTTDIVAYFGGKLLGGPKLCPAISPKKTWSGAFAGTLGAIVAALIVMRLFGGFNWIALAFLGLLLSVFSQLGDLLESAIKRRFGAKDAGHLIPGHGGVMDRLDGFWAAALAACAIGLLHGGFDEAAQGLLVW